MLTPSLRLEIEKHLQEYLAVQKLDFKQVFT